MCRSKTAILFMLLSLVAMTGCDSPSEADYVQDLGVLSFVLDGEQLYPIHTSVPAEGRVGDTLEVRARTIASCDWSAATEVESLVEHLVRIRLYNRRASNPTGPCAGVHVFLEHHADLVLEEPGTLHVEILGIEAGTTWWWERDTPPDTIIVTRQIEVLPRD